MQKLVISTSILTFFYFLFIFQQQILILKCCRFYNTFGSGASHGIYAQFIAQSTQLNNGRAVGLLLGAGTRMATFFYAMLRLIRLQTALKATVNQVKFRELLKSVSSTVSIREQCVADLMRTHASSKHCMYCFLLSFPLFVCCATVTATSR
jgi:hypothetical protein